MVSPGFVHDPFAQGGICDLRSWPDFFRVPVICQAAHDLPNEGHCLDHGIEVFSALIRIVAFFEVFEIDLWRIAWVVGAKRHFSTGIAGMGLQDEPGEVVLDRDALRIALFIASKIRREAEDEEVRALIGILSNG